MGIAESSAPNPWEGDVPIRVRHDGKLAKLQEQLQASREQITVDKLN